MMKYFIASDIHGSAYYCKKLLECYKNENADRIILLGDLLYHGPRNDLPEGYDPKQVTQMLNDLKDEIFCVRGNCDAEVDQMVLEFPILADYAVFDFDGRLVFATHGHIYNENRLPPLKKGDVLLCGHTHISKIIEHDEFIYMNPGSVSIPKAETKNGYMTFENGKFLWKDLEMNVICEYEF